MVASTSNKIKNVMGMGIKNSTTTGGPVHSSNNATKVPINHAPTLNSGSYCVVSTNSCF